MLRKLSPLILVGAVFAIAGIALAAYSVNGAWEQRQYAVASRVADGAVLDKRKHRINKSVRHLVGYRFATGDGQAMEGEGDVQGHAWETLVPGSPIRIEYAAGHPRINRPYDGLRQEWWVVLVFFSAGILFAAVGAGLISVARKQASVTDATSVNMPPPARRSEPDPSSQTHRRNNGAARNRNAKFIIPLALGAPLVVFILDRTDAPRAVYVACAIGFALAIPLLVFYLMAQTGWSTLAKRFRQSAPFNGAWRSCPTAYMAPVRMDDSGYESSKMGFISTLRVGTSAEALYLSMLFSKVPVLGLFFPNVEIPWSTIGKARTFNAPGFFKKGDVVLVQVNYDPNYTGAFVELEIGEPPVFLQLPVGILGDAIRRLPLAARA